jgi:transcriptional regulator with XRE-family HTH domain
MTETKNPAEYTHGLSELIRAHRLYMGLTKDGMASKLGMADRSYERIESGERDCPPGLLDHIDRVVDEFDTEVDKAIAMADEMLVGKEDDVVRIELKSHPRNEWVRAVIGRAAIRSGLIMPVLIDGVPRDNSFEEKHGLPVEV